MANRRPITMQEISFSNSQSQDSHLSVHLKEEPKNTLIQLLGTNTQTFCTASARVSVKSGSELLARYSGHLCLVNVKTDDDNSKQLQLFDLEKREIIWKQTVLDDTMEMTRDRNSLIIRFGEDQTIKLKFNSDSEAEDFFENAKVTIRVKSYERRKSLFERATSFHGLLRSNKPKKPATLEISAPQPTDELLQKLTKSMSVEQQDETASNSTNRHIACEECIHTCLKREVKSPSPLSSLLSRRRFTLQIGTPYNVAHSEHLSPECCSQLGFEVAPTLQPKDKVNVNKADISAPDHFDHVKHFSENPLKVATTDCNSLPIPAMFDRKSLSTVNCMPAIAEVTSDDSEDQHSCASCIHQYSEMQGRKPVGNKQRYSMFETGISGPFDVKHVCHINADCKYIKGLKLFGTMPSLVPPSQPVSVSNQRSVAKDRKISKFDIGQPFDFKHLEHVRFNTQNDDGQHDEHL